jgi:hypothetical protein
MFLSNFSAASQLIVVPFVPSIWKDQFISNLESNDLNVLLPTTFLLSSVFAFIIAGVRSWKGIQFDTSIIIGYLVSIAAIQIIGAIPWILLAFLFRNIGPYEDTGLRLAV